MSSSFSSVAWIAALCMVQGCGGTGAKDGTLKPGTVQSVGDAAVPAVGTRPAGADAAKPATGNDVAMDPTKKPAWGMAVEPKALSATVRKGLDWVLEHQHADGGFGQGEEASGMGDGMNAVKDRPNVADTCIAALTLVRSGEGFGKGRYANALERAVGFVCGKIEASDADSLSVTDVNGTRVQMKIGTYVDTFLASMLLSEVQGRLAGEQVNERARTALAKVVHKIEKNQQKDGTWNNQGWAPILSQSLAGKGLNRASQSGLAVDSAVLEANEDLLMAASSASPVGGRGGGTFSGPGDALGVGPATLGPAGASGPAAMGAAGVSLYALSANVGVQQDGMNTRAQREEDLRDVLAKSKDEKERKAATVELAEIAVFKKQNAESQKAVIDQLDNPQFVAGFGSNGGEEFLSYMNISESLVVRADQVWKKWDTGITQNLARVQNGDGSWTGHHCITGRTFCTSAALLVLMSDRSPVPVENVKTKR